MRIIELSLEGMTCDHCAETVRVALAAVPRVAKVEVSYADSNALVWSDQELPTGELLKTVARAGYRATVCDELPSDSRREG